MKKNKDRNSLCLFAFFLSTILLIHLGCQMKEEAPLEFYGEVEQGDSALWFEDNPVIGNMSVSNALSFLKEIGETEGDLKLKFSTYAFEEPQKYLASESLTALATEKDKYLYTSHVFGFIPKDDQNVSNLVEISHAGTIQPDISLRNSRIRITLDRLVVIDYPGKGLHHILFDFYAQNQLQDHTEHIHFNQVYRVQEGEQAGIIGYPVFIGLNVGEEGVSFKGFTVNVQNEQDKKLVEFLDGDLFQSGLKLLNRINPITPVLSSFVKGFTEQIAKRNKNVPVQDFYMGLDFSSVRTRARLNQGSYVVVQVPDPNKWDWSKWIYNMKNGQVVYTNDHTRGIPYNYIIFSVSKMNGISF